MYAVVFHPKVIDDLERSFDGKGAKKMLRKTATRLRNHSTPDGRVIKRLHLIVTAVFFEYKVRQDWRAIFYIDETHREVRILGYVPKNIGSRLFDRELEHFLATRYRVFSSLAL